MSYSETIAQLKSKYPFLAVIEVWENVLFLRMTKGRCVFHRKKGTSIFFASLEVGTWVLAAENEIEAKQVYKKMATKLHPDKVNGSHNNFIKLKTCYEHYKAIRVRFGSTESEYFSDFYSRQRRQWEDRNGEHYGSYEEYLKRRKEQDEYARRQVEELGVPF